MAELRPTTEYDYRWLRVWVKQLGVATVSAGCESLEKFNTNAGPVTYQAALGLLLLLWLAETARRKAIEGELWPHVANDCFRPEVQRLLFTQGQPARPLREMLKAAAERFQLRHVLHEAGVQRWLDTVFLQFGFTRRGSQQHLQEWLGKQATTRAITTLLAESATFRTSWEALYAYRRAQITAEQVRERLADIGNYAGATGMAVGRFTAL